MKRGKDIVVSTPDYPPHKLGGLATLSKSIVDSLKSNDVDVEVLIWNKPSQVKSCRASTLINIHIWPLFFMNEDQLKKTINFIHGSEVIPFSKNPILRLLKRLIWSRLIRRMEMSKANIFISKFSLELTQKFGLQVDHSRDIVFPNRTVLSNKEFVEKTIGDEIVLCCMARDIPHKNLEGVVKFAHILQQVSKKKIALYITSTRFHSDKIKIMGTKFSNDQRDEIYHKAHFNLLLSLDHSKRGQVEGFGLTPLEAAIFSTPSIVFNSGGLSESVHHGQTGWVFDQLNDESIEQWWRSASRDYAQVAKSAYEHVNLNHNAQDYQKLLRVLV